MRTALRSLIKLLEERLGPEGLITLGGLVTSWIVVRVNGWFFGTWDTDLTGYTLDYVIPIGAIGMGAAATSGHYLASVFTDRPARRRLAWNMVALSLTTYAWIQFDNYNSIRLQDGGLLSDRMGFWLYYTGMVEHIEFDSISSSRGRVPLGNMAYAFEALRIAGFGLAGMMLYWKLRQRPWCERCAKYMVDRRVLLRTDETDALQRFRQRLDFETADLDERFREKVRQRARFIEARMTRCPDCDYKRVDFVASTRHGVSTFATYGFRGAQPYRPGAELDGTAEPELPPPEGSVRCWSCRTLISATPETAGKRVPCPGCGILTRLPDQVAPNPP